jgi:hypothetical protein
MGPEKDKNENHYIWNEEKCEDEYVRQKEERDALDRADEENRRENPGDYDD